MLKKPIEKHFNKFAKAVIEDKLLVKVLTWDVI